MVTDDPKGDADVDGPHASPQREGSRLEVPRREEPQEESDYEVEVDDQQIWHTLGLPITKLSHPAYNLSYALSEYDDAK